MSHSPGLVAPATPRLFAAHPQLFVADVAQAAVFYRAKLGFTVEYLYGEPPFYGLVSRDGVGLNLRHTDAPPFDAILREQESLLSANIPVEGVEELFAESATRESISRNRSNISRGARWISLSVIPIATCSALPVAS